VVGVADPDTPEIKLKLDAPLKGKPEIGEEIEFEGIPSAFQPDPFLITFDTEVAKIKGRTVKPAGPAPVQKKRAPPTKKKAA